MTNTTTNNNAAKASRDAYVSATRYHREADPATAPLREAGYDRSDWTTGFCWAHPASGQDSDSLGNGHPRDTHWLIASERDGYSGLLPAAQPTPPQTGYVATYRAEHREMLAVLSLAPCYASRVTLDENGEETVTDLGHMLTVAEAMRAIALDIGPPALH
jgi:hypothetical protein